MNRILTSVFLGVLIACLSASVVAGQEAEVPLNEVLRKTQRAETWLLNITCRTSTTREDFDEKSNKWVLSSTFMTENVPPGRYRWVQENFDTPTKRRIEMVTVDGRRYRKVDDGSWEEVALPPTLIVDGVGGGNDGVRSAPRISSKARLIAQTSIASRNVSVYEVQTVPTAIVNDSKAESRTVTYWLRDDGFLLKKIEEVEVSDHKSLRRLTTLCEYNDIKIDAPVMLKKENN